MPPNPEMLREALAAFRDAYAGPPAAAAYAPGRVEVLGNHTDYNEGFVLSAAINAGTLFLTRGRAGRECRVLSLNLRAEARFAADAGAAGAVPGWARYIQGMYAQLRERFGITTAFEALCVSDVPLGGGLASSAALEMAAGLAFGAQYAVRPERTELARMGQRTEHEFVGVLTGLLDQITSLFGRRDALVMTDFRSLDVQTAPLGQGVCFLIVNTGVKHELVASEYNERRAQCEQAARFFAAALPHPVSALRDVSWAEWAEWQERMEPVAARRAAHVIGENARVLSGRDDLAQQRVEAFGARMFASHASSRVYFENSCAELDYIVDVAQGMPGVLGGRLSGGGFGGSAVLLLPAESAARIAARVADAYGRKFDHPCRTLIVSPVDGAAALSPAAWA
jgi:galactokinase